MHQFNIHDAKTHLSKLVESAANGEPFIIAKAGKPMVKVVPVDAPAHAEIHRLGFLAGLAAIPDDFNTLGSHEIE